MDFTKLITSSAGIRTTNYGVVQTRREENISDIIRMLNTEITNRLSSDSTSYNFILSSANNVFFSAPDSTSPSLEFSFHIMDYVRNPEDTDYIRTFLASFFGGTAFTEKGYVQTPITVFSTPITSSFNPPVGSAFSAEIAYGIAL